ncbi:hypothetical protein NA57DRAFT_44624 [Rhizodiscina lignyota]|uniref:NACHT domain-containing protein n=1 Tax=Rhizodiscina lignyota TaxID=1504668 RepID=A0A9P4IB54_9PEZI|nr:hypothetical protein NA57DRAFT_44624 [Rhizodiscina lignyota]
MSLNTSSIKELQDLTDSLPDREKSEWTTENAERLLDSVKNLNEQHAESSRTRRIIRRIDPLITFLRRFARFGDTIVQAHPNPACIAWGSFRILLEIVSGFTSYFEKLFDMLESIDRKFPLFEKFANLHSDSPACGDALKEVYSDVVLFLYDAQRIFKQRAIKILVKTVWKSFEEKFRKRQSNLEGHISQFESAVEFAHQRTLQFERRRHLMQWLAPVDVEMELQRLSAKRTHGTCAWIYRNDVYKQWRDNPGQEPLWIYGGPGAGKTVLSTTIIADLQQQETADNQCVTAFYYFDRAEGEKSGFMPWICSLISQLVARLDPIPQQLIAAYEASSKQGRSRMTLADYPVEILVPLSKSFSKLFLVFDGLDEATEIGSMRQVIATLTALPNVHLVCLGRPVMPVRNALSTNLTISLDEALLSPDINVFLQEEIAALERNCDTHGLMSLLYPSVSEGAKGIFLWAHLMVEALKSASSVYEMTELTTQLPQGLVEMYAKTLDGYSRETRSNRDLVKRIFIWVCTSTSPLKWRELEQAISLHEDDVRLDRLKMPFKGTVIKLCSPLIQYSEREDLFRPSHFSVVEYLLGADFELSTVAADSNTASHIRTKKTLAHSTVASTCLKYLSFPPLDTAVHWDDNSLPLTSYATSNVCHHISSAGKDPALEASLSAFLSSTTRRRVWLTRWLLVTMSQAPLQNILHQQRATQIWLNSAGEFGVPGSKGFLQDTLAVMIQLNDILEPADGNRGAAPRITVSYFDKMTVIRDLSRAFTLASRLQDGIDLLENTLIQHQARFGLGSKETIWIIQSLGIFYDQGGTPENYKHASDLQNEALEIQRRVLPKAHLEIAWAKDELGRVHRHLSDLQTAEKMHQEALEILEHTLPEDAMMTIATRNALARTYRLQHRPEEALMEHKRALSAQERTRGLGHAHTLWTLTDIAKCLRDIGRNQEAYHEMMTALNGRCALLGPDHPDTLWTMNDVGLLLARLGRRDEAKMYHEGAKRKQIAVLGPSHPFTVWTVELLDRWQD